MSKSRDDFYGAINVLKTFPNYLIKQAIEKINDYVINNLEETRKIDNKIITELHNDKIELLECLTLVEEAYRINARIPIVSIRKLIERLK